MPYKFSSDYDKAYRHFLSDSQTSSTSLSSTPSEVSFGTAEREPSPLDTDIKPAVDFFGRALPILSSPVLIPAEEIWRRAIIPTAINLSALRTLSKDSLALGVYAADALLGNYKSTGSFGLTDSQKAFIADESSSSRSDFLKREKQAYLEPLFPHVTSDTSNLPLLPRLAAHADVSRYADTFTKPWAFSGALDSYFRDKPDEYFATLFPNSDASVNKYIFGSLAGAFDIYGSLRLSPKLFSLTSKGRAASPDVVSRSATWAQQAANGERVLFNYPLFGSIKGQRVFDWLSRLNHHSKLYQAAKIAKSYGTPFAQVAHADYIINKTPWWLRTLSNSQNFIESLSNQTVPSRILASRISAPDDLFSTLRTAENVNKPLGARFPVIGPDGLPFHVFPEEVSYLDRVAKSLAFAAEHPNLASAENNLKSFFMGAYGAKVAARNATSAIGQSINSGANIFSPSYISTFFKALFNRPLSPALETARKFFNANAFASQTALPPSASLFSKVYSYIPRKFFDLTSRFEKAARLGSTASLMSQGNSLFNAINAVRGNFVDYFVPSLASRSVGTVFPFQQFLFGNQLNNLRLFFTRPGTFALPYLLRDRVQRFHEDLNPDDARPISFYDNKYGHRAPLSNSTELNFGAFFPQYNNPLLNPIATLSNRASLPYAPVFDVAKDVFSPEQDFVGSSNYSFHQHSPFGVSPTSDFGLFSARNFARAKRLMALYAPLNELDDLYSSFRSRALNSMFGDRLSPLPEYLSSWVGLYPHMDKTDSYLRYQHLVNAYLTNNPDAPAELRQFKKLLDDLSVNRFIHPSKLPHDEAYPPSNYLVDNFLNKRDGSFFDWYKRTHHPFTPSDVTGLGTFLHDSVFNKYRRLSTSDFYDTFIFGKSGLADSLISSIPYRGSSPSTPEARKKLLNKLVSGGASFKTKVVDEDGKESIRGCFAELYNELPVLFKYKPDDPEPLFAGTSDFVLLISRSKATRDKPYLATISDLKFGYSGVPSAPFNPQLKVYALSLMQMYPSLNCVELVLHQPGTDSGLHRYYIYRPGFRSESFSSDNSASTSGVLQNLRVDDLYKQHKADPDSHWNDRASVLLKLDTLLYNHPEILSPLESLERPDLVRAKKIQNAKKSNKK